MVSDSTASATTSNRGRRRGPLLRALLSPRYPTYLFAAVLAWWAAWSIDPPHPSDFVLEHVLTVLALVVLVATRKHFRFSNLSYTMLFVFLCLHIVGAHYTYAEVPYVSWCRHVASWFGVADFDLQRALSLTRNHYDRLVHLAFGLLCAYPIREVFLRIARVRGFWSYYLPLDVTMAFSMLYELLEWGVTMVFAADVGQSYLGTQGDVWDAHKDMALASLGGLLAMTVTALVNWRLQRDFAREFQDSLRVADPVPLGEHKLAAMLDQRQRP